MLGGKKDVGDTVVEKLGVKWTKLAKTCRVVPWPGAADGAGEAKTYNFRVFEIGKITVPSFLLDVEKETKGAKKVQVHLCGTMFDTQRKAFFGNTWTGRRLPLSECCKPAADKAKWNGQAARTCTLDFGPNYGASFLSAANLENVRLALEVVMTEMDATQSIRGQEYSVCWTPMKMDAKRDLDKFVYSRNEADVASDTIMYSGTPRLLAYVGTDAKLLGRAKVDKSECKHITMTHEKLSEAAKALMCPDDLVCGDELSLVPGLSDQARLMDANGPRVLPACPVSLEHVAVEVGDLFGNKLEEYIKASSGHDFKFEGLVLEAG
eukprot:CAMPEP_0114133992 /NCGR_PEP_ID=MMETSP0043_2-20121206/13920_1 /TAXON_ID=464988 /ORGANISM="Hemiselmis andersenii, Strain CCMP644" /LENGTH=321 /DNA_ID=CAMNT_0001227603 /DNA_START=73 /DNA_END=1035 /DNA_ORIENTATION=+